jgi:hypothetical protein
MLKLNWTLASRELCCSLDERRFHRLSVDHDHEIPVANAAKCELRKLV